jgi:hypothetical protein
MSDDAVTFFISASSEYGRDEADVEIHFVSDRPAKRLAELLVLELALQRVIGKTRGELQRALPPSPPLITA